MDGFQLTFQEMSIIGQGKADDLLGLIQLQNAHLPTDQWW